VPFVDGVVVLHAGVGAAPSREADLLPQFAGLERFGNFSVRATGQVPSVVFLDGLEEAIGDADGIVGVLAGDGVVGFAVEVVIELEAEFFGEFLVLLGQVLDAFGHAGDFQLFADFPVDKLLDIGVIEVEADHLGSAAGGAAGFDCAGGAVADLEEGHQARGFSAAGEFFVFAAEF
jgi:hypothetical protein